MCNNCHYSEKRPSSKNEDLPFGLDTRFRGYSLQANWFLRPPLKGEESSFSA